MEDKLEEIIFSNIQKDASEFGNKINSNDDFYEDEENLMFDIKQMKENLKSHMMEENLYDPLLDCKEEEWTNKHLKKDNKSTTVLSCPYCFTQVCYDCQRHDVYENQYRALYVRNCKINCTKTIEPIDKAIKNKKEASMTQEERLEDLKDKCKTYFSVECGICGTEVGVYESDEKIYYFFHVIPGVG